MAADGAPPLARASSSSPLRKASGIQKEAEDRVDRVIGSTVFKRRVVGFKAGPPPCADCTRPCSALTRAAEESIVPDLVM